MDSIFHRSMFDSHSQPIAMPHLYYTCYAYVVIGVKLVMNIVSSSAMTDNMAQSMVHRWRKF